MNKKVLLFSLLLVLWLIGGSIFYSCQVKGYCIQDIFGLFGKPEISIPKKSNALFFKNSSIIDPAATYILDSLCQLYQSDSALVIEGEYFGNESNLDTSIPNLGLARAMAIRDYLSNCLDTQKTKFSLKSHELGSTFDSTFLGVNISKNNLNLTSLKEASVVMHKNSFEIYFPSSSIKGKISPALDSAIVNYVNLLKNDPNTKILVEGHSDNVGPADPNKTISLERANSIKKMFINKGIAADRIATEGYGSEKPKVENNSPENRAINRRVEVKLLK